MKREFIIKALIRLKEFYQRLQDLEEMGINLSDFYEPITGLLEEAIATSQFNLTESDESDYIYEQLANWIYSSSATAGEFLTNWKKENE